MTVPTIDRQQLAALRLRALHVTDPLESPAQVVSAVFALQAQNWAASRWAIGARMKAAASSEVAAAFTRGEIVRAWPIRNTIHITGSTDYLWLRELAADRAFAAMKRHWGMLGIDASLVERVRDIVVEKLTDSHVLARRELLDVIERAGITLHQGWGYHLIRYLTVAGVLISGPVDGAEPAEVLSSEWLPPARPYDRAVAVAALVRGYVVGHGPVQLQDAAWWSGLGLRDVRAGFEACSDVLQEVECEGQHYWLPRSGYQQLDVAEHDSDVHALPAFDEFVLGYKTREAVLDTAYAQRLNPGGNGMFKPFIVCDGRIVGTWSSRTRATGLEVDIETFEPVDHLENRVEAEITRFAEFNGTAVAQLSVHASV